MGVFPSPNEARQRSYVSSEDNYKRKSQRNKIKDGEKALQLSSQEKAGRCSLSPLKFIMVFIVCATVITLLHAPPICNTEHFFSHSMSRPNIVKRLIWGITDPRYESHLGINWNGITKTIGKLKEKEYHSIGLLNFSPEEIVRWKEMFPQGEHTELRVDYADENVSWESLFPEWIDEEEEEDVPVCPSLPRLEAPRKRIDLIAVKLPCHRELANWSKDVARLHLQLVAAGLAASAKGNYPVHVLFLTDCFPIPNLFTCKELVTREGNTWLYKPSMTVLREKLRLPVGSCELALPLKEASYKEQIYRGNPKREAYATILHSADVYVCGAIAAAQSIRMAGSTRDLVILVDETISEYHRSGLEAAGWKTRTIQRIRNPKAEKDAYNEWNYSKFRLWQLTDYEKIIFIDADLLILRNIDFLFSMPEISATGNNATLFNSGVMVIEPSNCTFNLLMDHIHEIESYNGGDQGYLNEIFTWWHRIPRHMNFLKHFWVGDEEDVKRKKTWLFGAEPPELYVLHYLGMKPWLCFRDYDCNWNSVIFQEFASDVAHARWWRVHDTMPGQLQQLCLLRTQQKAQLEWDRREAEKANFTDGHWKIEVKDKRQMKCIERVCSWRGMLRHWGETNWTDDKPTPSPPVIRLAPLPSS